MCGLHMLDSYSLKQYILSDKNLFTFDRVLTSPMQITCIFLGENWKGILTGWGKATTSLSATESCFPISGHT